MPSGDFQRIPVDVSKQPKGPPYKQTNGHWITTNLFFEQNRQQALIYRSYEPIFSLYSDDIEHTISCRKTFLELGDPSGYKWAIRYLGSWDHWLHLVTKAPWFRTAYNIWLNELEARLKVEGFDTIRKIASQSDGEPPAVALAAAKYLASAGWKKTAHGRGRPSGEEIDGELKKAVEAASSLQEDAKRIGLVAIPGGKSSG